MFGTLLFSFCMLYCLEWYGFYGRAIIPEYTGEMNLNWTMLFSLAQMATNLIRARPKVWLKYKIKNYNTLKVDFSILWLHICFTFPGMHRWHQPLKCKFQSNTTYMYKKKDLLRWKKNSSQLVRLRFLFNKKKEKKYYIQLYGALSLLWHWYIFFNPIQRIAICLTIDVFFCPEHSPPILFSSCFWKLKASIAVKLLLLLPSMQWKHPLVNTVHTQNTKPHHY